jgi:hypothetical protein
MVTAVLLSCYQRFCIVDTLEDLRKKVSIHSYDMQKHIFKQMGDSEHLLHSNK